MILDPAKIPVSDSAKEAIERVLHARLDRFGLGEVVIKPGSDFMGEPVLFIDVHFPLVDAPVDAKAIGAAIDEASLEVQQRLSALGEDRFAHVTSKFSESQRVLGFS